MRRKICLIRALLFAMLLFQGYDSGKVNAGKYIVINETTFPEKFIREYVSLYADRNKDGRLSKEERALVEEMILATDADLATEQCIPYEGMKSIKGLEYFPNLKDVEIRGDSTLSIDVKGFLEKHMKLRKFCVCGYVDLGNIVIPQKSVLQIFSSSFSKIKSINLKNAKNLRVLSIFIAGDYELDVSKNTKLQKLEIDSDIVKNLDLHKHKELQKVDVRSDSLQSLNVKGCKKLKGLICVGGTVGKLDLSDNKRLSDVYLESRTAETLYIGSQKLKKLIVDNHSAKKIYINTLKKNVDINVDPTTQVIEKIVKLPKKVKVKAKKNRITWSKSVNSKKYQVYFCKKKKGTYKLYRTTKKRKCTLNKKGYVKVRGLIKGYNTDWYGEFSTTKRVTI